MSKIVCGVIFNALLLLLVGFCFNETIITVTIKALDFQGSFVVVALLVLVGIFCYGEMVRED